MHKLNFQQLHFAYLPSSAKFYGVSHCHSLAESRLIEGFKNGKYDNWLFKNPPKPTDSDRDQLCA